MAGFTQSLRYVTAIIIALPALTIACIVAADGEKIPHWIVAQTATHRVAINPISIQRQELPFDPNRSEFISPNGKQVAILLKKDQGELRAGLHLAEVDAHGARRDDRMLVPGSDQPHDIQWLPDSTGIIAAHGEGASTQVYRIEIAEQAEGAGNQAKIHEVRLSDGKDRSFKPAVSSSGAVAWLALRDQKHKQRFIDLMVIRKPGETPARLIERKDITAFAFSADGTQIAWSTHGELTIIDVADGRVASTIKYTSINENMYAYHARALTWAPHGHFIAAVLKFSGGRLIMHGEEPEPMLGDRDVFIIPLAPDQKAMSFALDEDTVDVEWIAGAELPQPQP